MKIKIGALLASAVFVALSCGTPGAAMASPNLVTDGDFSAGAPSGTFTTYFSGNLIDNVWVVTGSGSGPYGNAGVDLIGNYWSGPPGGGTSVDLGGDAPGGLVQTLPLVTGKTYDLSFYLSGNPDGSPTTKSVTVSVGGLIHTYTYTLGGANSHINMDYTPENIDFVGNGNQNLTITSNDTDGSPFGPVIGGVSVTAAAVPEPFTLSLFGAGLAGAAAMRRRRKAKA